MEKTFYAPAHKKTNAEIIKEHKKVSAIESVTGILEALPFIVLVLNEDRQIVHSNTMVLSLLGIGDIESILSLRPGDLLNCVNVEKGPGGCGTSKNCSVCGALHAILECQKTGKRITKEARISSVVNGEQIAWDLLVVATPATILDQVFTIISMVDISAEKRKNYLERLFYHDILNTSGVILGYADLLREEVDLHAKEMAEVISTTTTHLVEEIKAQRELSLAENGELTVTVSEIDPLELVKEVEEFFGCLAADQSCYITMDCKKPLQTISTDRLLLTRILSNLTKNALEASSEGDTVHLNCWIDYDQINFSVQNPLVIPDEIRMQIFNRSFSTKGANRGLGTYSIKLLTERYLKGCVSFISDEDFGTIFSISIPIDFQE